MNITIIGAGYVGLTTAACFANLGHKVLCIDINEKRINELKGGKIPFYEPGLKDLVVFQKEKNRLSFSTDIKEGVAFSNIVFSCVGTPQSENGSADLSAVFEVAKFISEHATEKTLIVNRSTVPPGTAEKCNELTKDSISIASNPEFMKEGSAIHDFTHPDKIVFGTKDEQTSKVLRQVYAGLHRPYVNIIETNWETAEMIKYANNSFLATKISFVNEIANICDMTKADIKTVVKAMGMDYRISPRFLNAGIGYGGSCFPKDIQALRYLAEEKGYEAKLLEEVHQTNERQKLQLIKKLKALITNLEGKTITIWGLSFKPKTSDIREAPSLILIKELLNEKAKINVYDPVAISEATNIFNDRITYSSTVQDSVKGSSAILLVTEWDEFRNVDLTMLGNKMEQKILLDGRNIYDPKMVQATGFTYSGIGRK